MVILSKLLHHMMVTSYDRDLFTTTITYKYDCRPLWLHVTYQLDYEPLCDDTSFSNKRFTQVIAQVLLFGRSISIAIKIGLVVLSISCTNMCDTCGIHMIAGNIHFMYLNVLTFCLIFFTVPIFAYFQKNIFYRISIKF